MWVVRLGAGDPGVDKEDLRDCWGPGAGRVSVAANWQAYTPASGRPAPAEPLSMCHRRRLLQPPCAWVLEFGDEEGESIWIEFRVLQSFPLLYKG